MIRRIIFTTNAATFRTSGRVEASTIYDLPLLLSWVTKPKRSEKYRKKNRRLHGVIGVEICMRSQVFLVSCGTLWPGGLQVLIDFMNTFSLATNEP